MRGHDTQAARIIPACAGETTRTGGRPTSAPDHPRLRGGNWYPDAARFAQEGSSPLARGKHHELDSLVSRDGIIPACAGETSPRLAGLSSGRDHPRLRGGNTSTGTGLPTPSGSSPLARGKRLAMAGAVDGNGIIPACAGETVERVGSPVGVGDHPRLRGGNAGSRASSPFSPGSSPLARGKHLKAAMVLDIHRIIPACAGETTCPSGPPRIHPDHPRLRGGNYT